MQVRTISPSSPCTSPVRRSRTWPAAQPADAGVADAHPAAERQLGAGLLAADEDRRAAVALGLDVGDAEADGAALAARRRPRPITGWKRSMCEPLGIALASQCSVIASSISPGPRGNVSRSRQSRAELVEVAPAPIRSAARGEVHVQT